MRVLYGIILGLVLLIVYINEYKKTRDVFSPLCLFSVLQFLRYVPHMIYTDEEHFMQLDDRTLFKTFLIELLFIFMIEVGYSLKVRMTSKRRSESRNVFDNMQAHPQDVDVPTATICFIFALGFLSRVSLIMNIGGFSYAFHNMGKAYSIYAHTSNGYVIALGNLMTLAEIMLIHKISIKPRVFYKLLLGTMVLLGMASYLVYSSRSPALEMLMICIFAHHYLIKRIEVKSIFKLRTMAIAAVVILVIVLLPSIRNESGNSSFNYENINLSERLGHGVEGVFSEFSYVGRDTFIYHHFDFSNRWYGRNYLNLFIAPIPSRVFHNKPVIDDGNYLSNIMYGYEVSPNQGRNDLTIKYSIPFSTQGCSYANFGISGIVVSAIFLGMLYRKAYYRLMKKTDVFSVVVYQLVIYQLELSTLSIMQTLIPYIIMGMTYYLSTKMVGRRITIV